MVALEKTKAELKLGLAQLIYVWARAWARKVEQSWACQAWLELEQIRALVSWFQLELKYDQARLIYIPM